MKIMVSACLLGINCKYNGGNNLNKDLVNFLEGHEIIPVCPETLGGRPTPRPPVEIVDGVVREQDGTSRDAEFRKGAEEGLRIAREKGIDMAILQSRSPSCGVKEIYDGTFTHQKIEGSGVFASLLKTNGFKTVDIEDLDGIQECPHREAKDDCPQSISVR